MSGSHRIWVGNMMFGASRSMLGTALALLRVEPTEVVWLRRGQSNASLDCAALVIFASAEEASRAIEGLHGTAAPFASPQSGGRLAARWANQRTGSEGAGSAARPSGPPVASRWQAMQPGASHGDGRPPTPRPSVSQHWRPRPIDAFGGRPRLASIPVIASVPTAPRSSQTWPASPWSPLTPVTPSPVVSAGSAAAPTVLYQYNHNSQNTKDKKYCGRETVPLTPFDSHEDCDTNPVFVIRYRGGRGGYEPAVQRQSCCARRPAVAPTRPQRVAHLPRGACRGGLHRRGRRGQLGIHLPGESHEQGPTHKLPCQKQNLARVKQ